MMAKEEANGTATLGENTSEMAELTGSAVLVVIGEPFTAEHKELILERITKGQSLFSSLRLRIRGE